MRVGIVCPYDLSRPGGVQAQVLGLAGVLRRQGDEVEVIGPGLPDGEHGVDLGPTITVPGNRSRVPISVDPRLSKVMRVVAARFDVLHVHEPLMPAVSLSALRAGPPVVATFHADPSRAAKFGYRVGGGRLTKVLGDRVRVITAVSPTAASVISDSVDPLIIPNGVDTSGMRVPAQRDSSLIVFLGRDEPRKGLAVLLEAWSGIREAAPEARLTVMGTDRGLESIRWLPEVDDETKTRLLNEAAVYVAPNTGGESFGIILVEAMAAGAAVVASDLGAFQHVGGDAVRYFKNRDSAALANAVTGVLGDQPARDALATRGIERAKQFDWDVVGPAYRDTYEAAIA